MNEFREIVISLMASNECAGSGKCQCFRFGYMTTSCLAYALDVNPSVLYAKTRKSVSVKTAEIFCGALGLDVADYEHMIYRKTNFDNKIPVGKGPGRKKFLPGRLRFGVDIELARKVLLCENNCCKSYLSVEHCADMVGTTGSLWRHIERGVKVYSFELFLQMCEVMGLDPRDYVGAKAPVARGGGEDTAAMNWLAEMGGRIAFGMGELPVTVFVASYGACSGETLSEAVAWMKRKISGGKKVA